MRAPPPVGKSFEFSQIVIITKAHTHSNFGAAHFKISAPCTLVGWVVVDCGRATKFVQQVKTIDGGGGRVGCGATTFQESHFIINFV